MNNTVYRRWVTPKEIADRYGFSVKSIQRMCRDGLLPAKKFGSRRWIIDAEALERLLAGPEGR